jgi:hypothetical protein
MVEEERKQEDIKKIQKGCMEVKREVDDIRGC